MTIKQRVVEYLRDEILKVAGKDAQRRVNGLARQFEDDTTIFAGKVQSVEYKVSDLFNKQRVEKANREHSNGRLQQAEAAIYNLTAEERKSGSVLQRLLEIEEALKKIELNHYHLTQAVVNDVDALNERITQATNELYREDIDNGVSD